MQDNNLALSTVQGGVVTINDNSAFEMQNNLTELKSKINMVQQFVQSVMKVDLDYGTIPGTDNRSLFQPGADKLNALYGFARLIKDKDEVKNFETGHYDVTVKVQLVHRASGAVVGEGEGSCSTRESKYRYRWVFESDLPRGIDKETIVSKGFKSRKTGKEYYKYRIENSDLCDVWNTVLKMAIKRAYVSATLAATGLSGIFQMDEEDFEAWVADGEGKEHFEKEKAAPKASDEKGSFAPPKAAGGHEVGNKITQAQYNKIIGDAQRKEIDEEGIKSIVLFVKQKPLNELSKADASAVIEFISKTAQDELQDLLLSASLPPAGGAV